jgi:parallel beta-helix repeat protein
MTQDNQFWWDKTNNVIVYRPPTGEDPNAMSIIVPTTTRIAFLKGAWTGASALTNVIITNLTFAVANARIGNGLKDDFGSYYSAAVACTFTTNCVIDNCRVYGVAGSGIGTDAWLNNFNMIVRNCIVHDIGAGGIVFHNGTACIISNNLVYSTGLLCQGGPGIRGSPFLSALVTHNTVSNCSGSGIVIVAGTNSVISYNYISRCVKALRDMGGIYVGQYAVSNSILVNYIEEVNGTNSDNGGVWDKFIFGIYCDANTIRPTVASNITYNCTRPFIYHMATNGIYLNNFFVNTRAEDTIINFHNADRTVVFQRNILFSRNKPSVDAETSSYIPFSLNANLAVADWHSNILWSVTGQNANNPTNATTADPLFLNLQPLNAAFQSNSPALGLGISPLRLNEIGLFSQGLLLPPTRLRVVLQ